MSVIKPVLIVGAGLTGLAAAMELSRLGVPVRLIDRLPGPSAMPRTLVVHSWTAELLGQRGLSPETLPASNRVTHAAVYRKGGLLGTAELAPDGPNIVRARKWLRDGLEILSRHNGS